MGIDIAATGLLRKLVVATLLTLGITACVEGGAVGCSGEAGESRLGFELI
jgi:hypothetical protein